jgi:small subunit ribosomal protein S17
MTKTEQKDKRTLVGEVISDLMDKTIVVKVERTFTHPLFHKIMRTNKKYKVHDAQEQARVGDVVEFYEGRPVSKTKYMYLARVVKTADKQ